MSLLNRIFPQNVSAEEEEYQPLDAKRMARLRWALEFELALRGEGPNNDPHPRPIIMVRHPRKADGNWPSQASWLGGLPRLGDADWPCDEDGAPLPFVAQISLSDLASHCPESPLPETGSFALFLGDGGVVHVDAGDHDPTPHPDGEDARDQIPYWPLDMLLLEMPPELRIYHDADRHNVIREAQFKLLNLLMQPRQGPFNIGNLRRSGACSFDTNYWQGPILLNAMFRRALDNLVNGIADQEAWLESARAELAELHDAQYRDDTRIAEVENSIVDTENDIPWQRSNVETFTAFCDTFAELVEGKDPWSEMQPEDYEPVLNRLGEAHGRFDNVLLPATPCNLEEMQDLCLRRMMSGDKDTFGLIPQDLLDLLNADFRLAPGMQHQMFGLGYGQPEGLAAGEDNLLLFQMVPDDLLETDLHGVDAWQFWISREDAAEGAWEKAKLSVRAS